MAAPPENPRPADPRPEDAPPAPSTRRPPPRSSGAPPAPAAPQTGGVERIVQEIREGLAEISAHEIELRRREQDFETQYRRLEQAARQAAARELEQAQQRLAERNAELSTQLIEMARRQAQLDERDEQLQREQEELERQRAALAQELEQSRRRVEQMAAGRDAQRESLRGRIATIRRQEQELARRIQLARDQIAQERSRIESQAADLNARVAGLEASEQRVRVRQVELDEQAALGQVRSAEFQQRQAELAAERAALQHERQRLREATEGLERQRAALAQELEQSRRRMEQMAARHDAQRESLRGRIATIRRQEQELARRIQLARDQIAQERLGIESQAADLNARVAGIEESEKRVQARQTELDEQAAQGQVRSAEFQQRQAELVAERTALQHERQCLREALGGLEQERAALAERQHELDQRWKSTHDQRHQLVRKTEDVATQRRALQREQAELRARDERSAERAKQLEDLTTAAEADRRRLTEQEAELARRVEAVDALFKQAEEVEQQAREHHDQALATREQAEAREREAGQAALTLEVELRQMEADRAALDSATQRLDALRDQREQELAAARRTLAGQTERLGAWERSLRSASRYWWQRATILAAVAAVLGVAAWVVGHPPEYRATTEIKVVSASPEHDKVAGLHAQRLLQPGLLDDDPGAADRAAAWRAACANRSVEVTSVAGRPVLTLCVKAGDARLARGLVLAAVAAYERQVNSAAAGVKLPPEYRSVEAWRDQLQRALAATRQARAADQQALAAVPGPEERERIVKEADGLQASLTGAGVSLKERRAALAALSPDEAPRGTVDRADVEKALADDTIYQEDRKELAAVVRQYRTELTVALLLLTDPTKELQEALAALAASLAEQRGLTPPAEVSTVLEVCAAEVERMQEQLKSFGERWQPRLEAVQGLKDSDDMVALVDQQVGAAEAATTISAELRKLLETLQMQIDALSSSGAGGTREVVVGAVLRSDNAQLKTAAQAFLTAAGKTALSENFELDAQDRRARGLRTRLAQRTEAVQLRLQLEADRRAAQERAARVAETRQQIADLETRREELLAGLTAKLKALRGLDDVARQRAELEGRISHRDAEIAGLDAQIAGLEQKLADALRQGPQPDRIEVGDVTTLPVSRVRPDQTALAGGGAFVAAWLACMLMMGRVPWRARRQRRDVLTGWPFARPEADARPAAEANSAAAVPTAEAAPRS